MQSPNSLVSPENVSILLEYAAKTPSGIFIEVGVYKGGTAYFLAELARTRNNDIWLFDTFEGMPEKTEGIDSHSVGDFADCSYNEVRYLIPWATFFKGFFPATLPTPRDLPPIAFVHVDCDQFESIKNCILRLTPYLVKGGIMYFDDYGCLEGATQAIDRFCPKRTIISNGKAIYTKE